MRRLKQSNYLLFFNTSFTKHITTKRISAFGKVVLHIFNIRFWNIFGMVIYIGSIQLSFFTPHQHHQTHNYKTKIRSLRKESPPFPKKILMNSLINKMSNQFVHTLLWLGLPKTPAPWLGLNPNFLLRCEIREMFGSPNADSFVGFGQFIEH